LVPLAEFNIGTLKNDWNDPRWRTSRASSTRVHDIARRAHDYVWHLEGDDMETVQLDPDGPMGGNPRTARGDGTLSSS